MGSDGGKGEKTLSEQLRKQFSIICHFQRQGFIKKLTVWFHPEKLISALVDRDYFLFHQKYKQSKDQEPV